MMLAGPQLGAKATPLSLRQSRPARRPLCVAAKSTSSGQEESVGRRNFLAALSFFTTFAAARAAKAAADPYEELRSIAASRTGTGSLLDAFEGTRSAVASSKADRGIRERLAAEATNAPKPAPPAGSSSTGGFNVFGNTSPKPAAPAVAAAPNPAAPAAAKPFSFNVTGPKPAAPKPAATAAAPAAAGTGGGITALGIAEAVGVLGLVGAGASAVTNFVTSNSKGKAKKDKKASGPAPAAASGTRKVSAGTMKTKAAAAAAAPARAVTSSTGKVSVGTGKTKAAPAAAAAPARARAAAATVRPAASSAAKVVKKVPAKAGAAAAAATGTLKGTIKQALVNEEKPDEPTDFAVAGFLGFAGILAAFFLFGLPKPVTVAPTTSSTIDPLVEEAKQRLQSSSFKAAAPAVPAPSVAAPVIAPPPAAPKVKVEEKQQPAKVVEEAPAKPAAPAKVEEKKPEPVKAAAPAPVPAAATKTEAKKAEAAAPAATEPAAAAAPSTPNNLLIVGGGLALIVAAFAAVGGGSSESGAATATGAPATGSTGSSAAAPASDAAAAAAAAETVSAAASTAAAAAAGASEGAPPPAAAAAGGDNAAYEKAVNALFADPDTADELYAIIAPALRNGPALAWALVSNPTNAETLDGWAYQKLSTPKYKRVRELLVNMGLQLPDTPKPQPTLATFGDVSAATGSQLDPEKLRSVFEALLANPASRTLMTKLLAGAGMPFNEAAFEEQIKDSTYFNLAIAPILRKMPQQKLAVLADLQDPAKLQELVNSVSSLAADNTQLDAVTAELSGDVRNTVEKIREDTRASSTASSR